MDLIATSLDKACKDFKLINTKQDSSVIKNLNCYE